MMRTHAACPRRTDAGGDSVSFFRVFVADRSAMEVALVLREFGMRMPLPRAAPVSNAFTMERPSLGRLNSRTTSSNLRAPLWSESHRRIARTSGMERFFQRGQHSRSATPLEQRTNR